MKTLQINYDLQKPGRNYQPLYDYIKSFAAWCHLLDSLWLVRTNKSVSDVRDELKRVVDANDKVAVFDVTQDSWATNFSNTQTEWLKDHIGFARAT